ncbi:hypothetical protein M9458_046141, partial [Cirrhinus mrigala]
ALAPGLTTTRWLKENSKLPAAKWWRYDYNWILTCKCLQARTWIKHMKFGAD